MVISGPPAITVGIPFFNARNTLLDAVRSVIAQTHSNWELILIDDGSHDGSLELARSLEDPRIRVYSDGKNRGLAARLNQLVQLARYEFVARMDADDLMTRDRLERQLAVLLANPDVDLISSGVVSLSDGWEPLGTRCVPECHRLTGRSVLAGQSGIVHAAILARRSWFLRNPYDEKLRLCEDGELWTRAYASSDLKIRILPSPLYYYREDSNVTKHKLLTAYRIQRQVIVRYSASYALTDRIAAWASSWVKSLVVQGLSALKRMDLLRRRRSATPLSCNEVAAFRDEIANIRSILLLAIEPCT